MFLLLVHRYEEFWALREMGRDPKHIYTICSAGIHRSVAWGWVLMKIGASLGWNHIAAAHGPCWDMDHICYKTRENVMCVGAQGHACALCIWDSDTHNELAEWFVDEFYSVVGPLDVDNELPPRAHV